MLSLRTFIDIGTGNGDGRRRLIVATCEKGSVEDVGAMKGIQKELDATRDANPNLMEYAGREVWKVHLSGKIPIPAAWNVRRRTIIEKREKVRIGMPRVLGMFGVRPRSSMSILRAWEFRPGISYIRISPAKKCSAVGSKRGAIDPCYPSKLGLAHIHNLLFEKHKRTRIDYIFFPMLDSLRSPLVNIRASNACPTTALTPEVVRAAFTKETDLFAQQRRGLSQSIAGSPGLSCWPDSCSKHGAPN